jgi:hypothetical protein
MILGRLGQVIPGRRRRATEPRPTTKKRLPGADDPVFERFHAECRPYTMRSRERAFASYDAAHYVLQHDIPGAFVECGTWRGGSAMMVALVLQQTGKLRDLYLFDTFQGMPLPEDVDVDHLKRPAMDRWQSEQAEDHNEWCYADRADVQRNVLSTGFPASSLHLVQGEVEQTIPDNAPEQIAFLHLDTDWYRSTKHELEHLFPRLAPGGVLIIDDYGHWQGARQATDEYIQEHQLRLFLQRVDYTGRVAVKQ